MERKTYGVGEIVQFSKMDESTLPQYKQEWAAYLGLSGLVVRAHSYEQGICWIDFGSKILPLMISELSSTVSNPIRKGSIVKVVNAAHDLYECIGQVKYITVENGTVQYIVVFDFGSCIRARKFNSTEVRRIS